MRRPLRCPWVAVLVAVFVPTSPGSLWGQAVQGASTGDSVSEGLSLYLSACAACHGVDGTGTAVVQRGFAEEVPDFTECRFASREPAADWVAVAHQGGPVRAFSRMMPAFGGALTVAQLESVVDYVVALCRDTQWPRGELNLPRSHRTEKAFPEDEAVLSSAAALEGPADLVAELIYERRIGPRSQVELVVPYGVVRRTESESRSLSAGLGDVAVAFKHVLFHDRPPRTILSAGVEAVLPTGDEESGLGGGSVVIEPFLSIGRMLPRDAFVQAQAVAEILTDPDGAAHGLEGRMVVGWSVAQGGWGRTWSPMLEATAARDLESGAPTRAALIPQVQVSLTTRQHVLLNAGILVPVGGDEARPARLVVYLLWDWFDGGLLDGW